jgi:ribose transport system permease protein
MTFLHSLTGKHRPILIAFAICLVLFAAATVHSPGFAGLDNIAALLTQASLIGLVGLGQTLVIIGGGIDLSIPWVVNGAAVLTTIWADGDSSRLPWVLPVVIVIGGLVGAVNGIGVTVLRIPPIIMTLGVLAMVQGALLVYTKGTGGQLAPKALDLLASTRVGPISGVAGVWILAIVVGIVILTWTVFGRRLYAVGTSTTAARFSGISERTVVTSTYVTSGITAAVAGVLLASYVQQSYLGMGEPYLFASVAAVAIGGASILGGTGNYVGTVAGALTLTVLTGVLPILGLKPAFLDIVYGAVILVAITAASLANRRSTRPTRGGTEKEAPTAPRGTPETTPANDITP